MNTYHIKNMVCPRCIMAVEQVLANLNIDHKGLDLGRFETIKEIDKSKYEQLANELQQLGFELLPEGKSSLISQIKALIVKQIHHSDNKMKENFSSLISEKLHHDYAYLSRLFSSVEGITIEKYITKLRIEKVKELIVYNELTLSQIAFELDYSSIAHLSSQFKKETGMTPSAYKNQTKPVRKSIDNITSKS